MKMDKRFLQIHPATAAWWDQRELCERCKHLSLKQGAEGEAILRCKATPAAKHEARGVAAMREARGIDRAYCIDARLEGQACGPEGRLFVAVPDGAA